MTSFEHPEISKYLADPDCADEDTYSDFRYLYERFRKRISRRVTQTTWSKEVTKQLPEGGLFKILLKELDHIQAILARYDTFFFLMKQLCATAVFIVFINHSPQPAKPEPLPIAAVIVIPIFFFITEYGFRFFHWSGYILRLASVRKCINSGDIPQCIYVIKETDAAKKRFYMSWKRFDCLFYGIIILIIALMLGLMHWWPQTAGG